MECVDPLDPVHGHQEGACLIEVPTLYREEPALETTMGAEDVGDGLGAELRRAVLQNDRRLPSTGRADLAGIEALTRPADDFVLLAMPAGEVLAAIATPDVQMPPVVGYGCCEKPTSRSKTVLSRHTLSAISTRAGAGIRSMLSYVRRPSESRIAAGCPSGPFHPRHP